MNMDSFDLILTVAALVMGVMLLTGHGDILMKGGNAAERKRLYDKSYVYDIIYLVLVIVIFIAMVVLIRKKCKK